MFLTFLPGVILAPLTGVLADKMNRKVLIAISDALQAFTTVVLIGLLWIRSLNVWLILGFNGLRAIFQSFHNPASSAITPLLVPKEKLSKITGLTQLFSAISDLASPILGAIFWDTLNVRETLWLDVITFVIAFALLIPLKIPANKQEESAQPSEKLTESMEKLSPSEEEGIEENMGILKEFNRGINIIQKFPGLWAIIVVMVLANFLITPFNALNTYFVNVTHGGNEWDLVILGIFINGGFIIGSIFSSLKKSWQNYSKNIFLGLIFLYFGIMFLAIAPEGNFIWMGIGGLIITILLPIATTLVHTILYTAIPPENLGRVSSLFMLLNYFFMLAGYLIAGPLAEWLGIVNLFLGASALGIILTITLYYSTRVKALDAYMEKEMNGKQNLTKKSVTESMEIQVQD
jgi:DHA3 family macrolide efflux protein-like MFS transporter